MVSFISFKRASVCALGFFPLEGVGTYFLFPFEAFWLEAFEEVEDVELGLAWFSDSWLSKSSVGSDGSGASGVMLPGSSACSGWQLSIELIIGNNLPNQFPKSFSSWNRFIPDDVFTFITASLHILMQRLNFWRVWATLNENSSFRSLHLRLISSMTFL